MQGVDLKSNEVALPSSGPIKSLVILVGALWVCAPVSTDYSGGRNLHLFSVYLLGLFTV